MNKLTANRVILGLHLLLVVAAAAAVFVTTLTGSLPKAWQPDLVLAASILGGVAASTTAVIKFLDGAQKFDALTFGHDTVNVQPIAQPGGVPAGVPVLGPTDPPLPSSAPATPALPES